MPIDTGAYDRQAVMRLMCMATYLARVKPAFSDVVAPARKLLRTGGA